MAKAPKKTPKAAPKSQPEMKAKSRAKKPTSPKAAPKGKRTVKGKAKAPRGRPAKTRIRRSKAGRFVGVDIGGTKLHAVVADEQGRILGGARRKTRGELGFSSVMERIAELVAQACESADVPMSSIAAVGVGAPSPILPDGTAVNAPNLGWKDVPLTRSLEKSLKLPVIAANDCDAGTFGEYTFGAAQGAQTVVGLFMGTGLGGGVVHHGQLLRGDNNKAAEIGHMKVVIGGRRCGCGQRGCLEAYASKTGMGKRIRCEINCDGRPSALVDLCAGAYNNIRSGILSRAYEMGDALTIETLHEAARFLGMGVANMITLLGPSVVVLGGGVFEALGESLIGIVSDAAQNNSFPPGSAKDTAIQLAALGDDAVALGAMSLAHRQFLVNT